MRERTEERRKLFIERVKRICQSTGGKVKEHSARVIKDGPMRAVDGGWRRGGGVSGCDTISVGPMGVEGRGGGGGLSSFQRQDKQGNESVIISRNCLPLCFSSPRPSTCLRSLAGHGLIKDAHCPKERHKVRISNPLLST